MRGAGDNSATWLTIPSKPKRGGPSGGAADDGVGEDRVHVAQIHAADDRPGPPPVWEGRSTWRLLCSFFLGSDLFFLVGIIPEENYMGACRVAR